MGQGGVADFVFHEGNLYAGIAAKGVKVKDKDFYCGTYVGLVTIDASGCERHIKSMMGASWTTKEENCDLTAEKLTVRQAPSKHSRLEEMKDTLDKVGDVWMHKSRIKDDLVEKFDSLDAAQTARAERSKK